MGPLRRAPVSEPLVVEIPMTPPRELSPNARVHWAARARQAKALREAAYWATVSCRGNPAFDALAGAERIALDLTVRWEKGRKRTQDDDNVWASFKNGRDGIAEALGIDDRRLVIRGLTQERAGKDDAGGYVLVALETLEAA